MQQGLFNGGLGFGKEEIEGDHFGPGSVQPLDDLAKAPPTPWPAPQLGNAAIVDGDQNDGCSWLFHAAQVETQVERFSLEIAQQRGLRRPYIQQGNDERT